MEKSNKLLEIVTPTYNHYEVMVELMDWYQHQLSNTTEVVLSIHDSSNTDEIEKLVKNSPMYGDKVQYFHYEPTMDIDEKTVRAMASVSAEYGFLVGDGFLVNVDIVLDFLKGRKKKYDVNCIYMEEFNNQFKNYFDKYYSESQEVKKEDFYKTNYCHIIFYGASILSKEFIERMNLEYLIANYNKTGFIYPSSIVHYANTFYVSSLKSLTPNQIRKQSGWVMQKRAFEIFAKKLYMVIESYKGLLNESDIVYMEKNNNRINGLFSIKSLLSFRANGNLTFKLYKEYKPYIKKMSCYSSFRFIFVLWIPPFVPRFLKKIKNLLKGSK